jgi:hypothetical protein
MGIVLESQHAERDYYCCRNKQANNLYSSQNGFWQYSKNHFARVLSSAPFVRGKYSAFFSPGKVLGAFCPGITATKIWFFEKPKTKSVLVYIA